MIYTPTYGGDAIFGLAVHIEMVPVPCAQQAESYFGVDGVLSVFGGSRGRTFSVSGVLFDLDIPSLNGDEALFTPGASGSLADGVARELFDTRGRTWDNVIYLGAFTPDPMGPRPAHWAGTSGWALPYRAVFHGLS